MQPSPRKGTQFISPARQRWVKMDRVRKDDTRMSQTYAANFVHCIFSTKDRRDFIPETLQERLFAYLFGIAKNLRITIVAVGGTANHIHLLISLPPSLPLAEAIQKLKANSSRWLGEQGMRFEWQKGYGAFSVSPSL